MTKRRMTKASQRPAAKTRLSELASRPAGPRKAKGPVNGARVVLQVRMREALRREIKRAADEAEVTCQTFVLMALRAQGVGVTDEDLLDLRKGENRPAGSSARDLNEMVRQSDPIKALLDLIEASDGLARESGNMATASHRAGGLTLIINNYAGKPDA